MVTQMTKFGLKIFIAWLFGALLFAFPSFAAQIDGLRIGQNSTGARVVFDADANFDYKVFTLSNPDRLVIDTQNVEVTSKAVNSLQKNNFVSNVRTGPAGVSGVRIVFDLLQPVVVKKAFILKPASGFAWRFAIDVETASEKDFIAHVGNAYAFNSKDYQQSASSQSVAKPSSDSAKKNALRRRIITIDAGHGGIDPGAIGYSGTYEKNITFAMAKELKAELDKNPRYKVYLTRSRDIFIPLRDRVKISRKNNSDLFISIHADSARNRKATGLSVYTLSETASDKEAEALAEKENKADIIAGVNFAEHDKVINDVLLNMTQRETLNFSSEFAGLLSWQMSRIVKTVSNTHRFAGFAVLKAPDVPSVLMELGYLSNPTEEKQLKQKSYRKKLVDAAVRAINKYFENNNH